MKLLTWGMRNRHENKIIEIDLSILTCLETKSSPFAPLAEIRYRQWKHLFPVQAFGSRSWKCFCH